jgi:hypothetical protein
MSVITDNAAIDAKAQAELAIVLAKLGLSASVLDRLGLILWDSAYKLGYAQGALDATRDSRAHAGRHAE